MQTYRIATASLKSSSPAKPVNQNALKFLQDITLYVEHHLLVTYTLVLKVFNGNYQLFLFKPIILSNPINYHYKCNQEQETIFLLKDLIPRQYRRTPFLSVQSKITGFGNDSFLQRQIFVRDHDIHEFLLVTSGPLNEYIQFYDVKLQLHMHSLSSVLLCHFRRLTYLVIVLFQRQYHRGCFANL